MMGRREERRPLVDSVSSFFLPFLLFFSFYLEVSFCRVHSLNLTRKRQKQKEIKPNKRNKNSK